MQQTKSSHHRMQETTSSRHLLVAAIDFGTTFSGYAFSMKEEFKQDPLRISCNSWMSGSGSLMSLKTPSCILFDPRKQFHSFGFEAEANYGDLTLDHEHTQWFYFRRFKMLLFQNQNQNQSIHQDVTIKDEMGNEMKALDVFSAAIRYLKDHLLQTAIQTRGLQVVDEDIKWVLTVPAIWDDMAKSFMRTAAEQAGIPAMQLGLSLEPEAAALLCKYSKMSKAETGDALTCFTPSSRYLVLDAGGGTVDITVHEVQADCTLRELTKANGGPWGGTTIDKAFFKLLSSITGPDVWRRFVAEYQDDFIELQRDVEIRKRTMAPEKEGKTTFKIPITLHELYREIEHNEISQAVRENKKFAGKLIFAGDKLRMENDVVKSLFEETNKNITEHLRKILSEEAVRGTDTILMVGGFSESPMLQDAVKRAFPDKNVLIPQEPGLAVLKGAVIFGHSDREITARISKYTYGLSTRRDFDKGIDPRSRLHVQSDGQKKVRKVFSVLVRAQESVFPDRPCPPKEFLPNSGGDTGFTIKLYASPDEDPKYVDDPGCVPVGEATVDCRDRYGRVGGAYVSLMFGGTEIEVMAVNTLSGEETKATFKSI